VKIAICVCTYKRPQMLAACLNSLSRQIVPHGVDLEVIVTDNQEDGGNRQAVEAFAADFPVPLHYVHQPERGISSARNACLDKSVALGAEWLAFIDDDEVAQADWFFELWAAHLRRPDAAAIHGPMNRVYPEDAPRWRCRSHWDSAGRKRIDGQKLTVFATNNVLLDMGFVAWSGLRFDTSRNLGGGEDTVFSAWFSRAGGVIIWAPKAVCYETIPMERISLRHQVKQAHHKGLHTAEWTRLLGGSHRKLLGKAVRRGAIGIGQATIVLPFSILLGPTAFLRCAMAAGRKCAESTGIVRGMLGASSQYYRNTTGY
jgi:succinoglycan biosynthesis protein ExoM